MGSRLPAGAAPWLAVSAASLALLAVRHRAPFLEAWPEALILPLDQWLDAGVGWLATSLQGFFRGIARCLAVPVGALRAAFSWLPWPATILAAGLIAWRAGGWRTALLAVGGLAYIVVTGYWPQTMPTLAVVAVAVPLSVAGGLGTGILAHRSAAARRVILPALDLMQTMPTFAYLVPILVLFGLGPALAVIASAIYAIPPMARATLLGLSRVPADTLDAARMAGSSGAQSLAWVELPASLPALLLGVNQAVMAVLGMAVIAAILGGLPDIGWEVFNAMKKAQFGQSILSGLVIALIAMILDRVTAAFAIGGARWPARPAALAALAALAAILVLAVWIPALREYPRAWQLDPAPALNAAVDAFTRIAFPVTQAIKDWTVFFVLQPLRIGMAEAVRPEVWGFAMSGRVTVVFAALAAVAVGAAALLRGWRLAVGLLFAAILYHEGTTRLPVPIVVAAVGLLAAEAGGWRLGLLAVGGLLFAAVGGIWEQTMVTVQLCGAGVVVAFVLGTAAGIAAGLSGRVSAVVRPVADTLQTMPIFVFLIPAIMVFLTGEFAAMVAIVLYAMVPAMRYAELGIRGVPDSVLEAARSAGATPWQLVRDVRLPLALPEFMMGLNQTIMMGLAMVIVAALAGARGLGQEIMIALTWLRVGDGLVAGLTVAVLAILADRITQALSLRKKEELGLS